MTRRLPLLLGASALALALGATTQTAEAGHVHFSGGVHVGGGGGYRGWSGGVHVYAGGGGGYAHWSRPYSGGYYGGYRGGYYGYRGGYGGYGGYGYPWWGVRGHVWVGGYYPYYWWPSYYYYPEYVPSYYGSSYYPVEPAYAAPGVTAVVAPRPELPKLGIGLFAGGVSTDYNTATNTTESDVGVLGRYRLTDGLIVEGELGKVSTSVKDPNTGVVTDNVRVDRRLGGSLLYEIGAYNRLAPYVLVGMGVEQASVNGDYSTTQDYAEIGAGLRLAITPHFHIAFDIRAGQRTSVSNDSTATMPPPNTTASIVTPPPSSSPNNSEDYTRGRLSAILYF